MIHTLLRLTWTRLRCDSHNSQSTLPVLRPGTRNLWAIIYSHLWPDILCIPSSILPGMFVSLESWSAPIYMERSTWHRVDRCCTKSAHRCCAVTKMVHLLHFRILRHKLLNATHPVHPFGCPIPDNEGGIGNWHHLLYHYDPLRQRALVMWIARYNKSLKHFTKYFSLLAHPWQWQWQYVYCKIQNLK